MMIDRVVEQQTINPSAITYEDSRQYPYHFHRDKNPCVEKFDRFSNDAPHTIIYKTRKPSIADVQEPETFDFTHGKVHLWNESWPVINVFAIDALGRKFPGAEIRNSLSGYLCLPVIGFDVSDTEVNDSSDIYVPLGESFNAGQTPVPACSLLGIVLRRLRQDGLHPVFGMQSFALTEHQHLVQGIFLRRIDPLFGFLDRLFPRRPFGLNVFANRAEPGKGKVGLNSFFPKSGDHIDVLYIATTSRERRQWSRQLLLPGLD
jgi:hypothetical protein